MANDKEGKCECCGHDHKRYGMMHKGFGSGFYCLGIIGAAFYYVQQVSGFWPIVVAILKALVWPAFIIYKVFSMLHM